MAGPTYSWTGFGWTDLWLDRLWPGRFMAGPTYAWPTYFTNHLTCWTRLLVLPTSCLEPLPVCTDLPAAQNYCLAVRLGPETGHMLAATKREGTFTQTYYRVQCLEA
jgi:hypothetical protein